MRDSVDQAPEDIQIQAIEQAQDWLTSEGLTFWRVIIPLWPETYERLLHQNLPPLDHHQLLPLGQVNPDSFLAARRKVQLHAVTNAKQFGPSLDLRSQQRRRRQCKAYLKTAYTILRPTFGNVINDLCASNLRLSGQLWHGMILSKSFYENRQLLQGKRRKLGLYDHLDALLTGAQDLHHRGLSPIRNIFYAVFAASRARDMLIGYHLLYVLLEEWTHHG